MMEVVLALIEREGRWFLQRRAASNPCLPGCWEFPGGKVEPGETLVAALARELREEVAAPAVETIPGAPLDGEPRLYPFKVRIGAPPSTPLAWGWFSPEEMLRLLVPPRNCRLIDGLAAGGDRQGGPSAVQDPV